ncbi:hypothetical protein KHP62_00795 [Rhodobacteraceae bacterium NNCM2]|nr:hypothetical protein [Coraliihabitans acroporae]
MSRKRDIVARLRTLVTLYRRDETGSISTEFVIWIPFFLFWFVFSIVIYDANKNRNDAAKSAYTISDLVSRQREVTDDFLSEIKALQDNLMPRTAGSNVLRVSNIQFVDGDFVVLWSDSLGGGQPLEDEDLDPTVFPTIANNDSVLVTEVDVPYTPLADWVGITAKMWSFDVITRPRFADSLERL